MRFQSNFNVIWYIESNIRYLILFNLFNILRESNKMLSESRILFISPNSLNKLNNTGALMRDTL